MKSSIEARAVIEGNLASIAFRGVGIRTGVVLVYEEDPPKASFQIFWVYFGLEISGSPCRMESCSEEPWDRERTAFLVLFRS